MRGFFKSKFAAVYKKEEKKKIFAWLNLNPSCLSPFAWCISARTSSDASGRETGEGKPEGPSLLFHSPHLRRVLLFYSLTWFSHSLFFLRFLFEFSLAQKLPSLLQEVRSLMPYVWEQQDILVKEKVDTWSFGQTSKDTSHSCLGSQVPSGESVISKLGKIFLKNKVLQHCKVGKTWDLKLEDLECESQLHDFVSLWHMSQHFCPTEMKSVIPMLQSFIRIK